jgi:hypothetical protein
MCPVNLNILAPKIRAPEMGPKYNITRGQNAKCNFSGNRIYRRGRVHFCSVFMNQHVSAKQQSISFQGNVVNIIHVREIMCS